MTCMKCVQKHFSIEYLCAPQVFLCALVSRPVCPRMRAQLRGNMCHGTYVKVEKKGSSRLDGGDCNVITNFCLPQGFSTYRSLGFQVQNIPGTKTKRSLAIADLI